MLVTNEKTLNEAIKNGQDYIEVEGDLVNKVFKFKANGKVVWGVIGLIALGIIGAFVGIGKSKTISYDKLKICQNNNYTPKVNSLNSFRDYNISRIGDKVILQK